MKSQMIKKGFHGFCMALDVPQAPLGLSSFQVVPCLVGLAIVLGMQWIKERGEQHEH